MNEETIVIALHGSLTGAEKALAQCAAGAAEVQEFHRQLFADVSALLLRKIKSITRMDVRHTSTEIDPTTGSVVHLFTTDTVGEDFPRAPSGFTVTPKPGLGPLCWHERRARRQANGTGFVIRG
jgi:Na+-translocating membrane potential-generating system (MpsC)